MFAMGATRVCGIANCSDLCIMVQRLGLRVLYRALGLSRVQHPGVETHTRKS